MCALRMDQSTFLQAVEFNYDWTYSTPYSGSSKNSGWNSIETSGIDISLLTDQTQPIIFFDDVHLYEDDMHDNGQAINKTNFQ